MALRFASLLSLLLVLSGCQNAKVPLLSRLFKPKPSTTANVPPRYSNNDEADDELEAPAGRASVGGSDIELTEFTPDQGAALEYTGADVVATVNSLPIFASDVLEPFARNLAQAETQLTPQEMNRLRATLIQKSLRPHVEKAVLVSALQQTLDSEQLKSLQAQIDRLFAEEEKRLKKEFNVTERIELQRLLEKEGTSLSNLKYNFAAREMAMFYLGRNAAPTTLLSRKDLMDWYEENKEQYRHDAAVKSQHIRIAHSAKNGGRRGAQDRLTQVVAELRNNVSFDEVAKKYSDGPKAAAGGHWDWTKKGGLAEQRVEQALFELPVNTISAPIETKSAFVIVKVVDRKPETFTPFEDVQDQIREQLETTTQREAVDKLMKDLIASADIRTMFPADVALSKEPAAAKGRTE